jgi:hypothetical protein
VHGLQAERLVHAAAQLRRNTLLSFCSLHSVADVSKRWTKLELQQCFKAHVEVLWADILSHSVSRPDVSCVCVSVALRQREASRNPRRVWMLYESVCAELGVEPVAAPVEPVPEPLTPRDLSTAGCVCGKVHPAGTPVHTCVFCGTAYATACSAMSADG